MKTVRAAIRRFSRQTGGSVAMMTGIMFPLFVVLVGGSTDLGRAYLLKNQAQRTLDASVLAMARSRMTDAEIAQKGAGIFQNDLALRDIGATVTDADFVAVKDGADEGDPSTVTARVTLVSDSLFLGIFGLEDYTLTLGAQATKPNPLPFEIAMVLDVSGSMNRDLNGAPRLQRLKEASAAFFDVIEQESAKDRPPAVALVPYSTSVSLEGFDRNLLESASVGGRNPAGKLWAAERFRGQDGIGYDLSDDGPDAAPIPFVTVPEIGNTEPRVPVQPLTTDRNSYRRAVEGLSADGYTAAHIGMAWGVYALSPRWRSVWPTAPKEYDRANKAIVVLTDGRFNTTQGIGARSNDDGAESNAYFQSACDLARRQGIAIYAVALNIDADSEQRLADCAAGSGGEMFSANSAAGLKEAFKQIGRSIGGLRLSG